MSHSISLSWFFVDLCWDPVSSEVLAIEDERHGLVETKESICATRHNSQVFNPGHFQRAWAEDSGCRKHLFRLLVEHHLEVDAHIGIPCQGHLHELISYLQTLQQIYQLLSGSENLAATLGKAVFDLSSIFTTTQCVYMWTAGILHRLAKETIAYVLVCFPLLQTGLELMRKEFMSERISCEQLVFWHRSVLRLIGPPMCELSKSEHEASFFEPICRAIKPSGETAMNVYRLLDWIFLFGRHSGPEGAQIVGHVPVHGAPLSPIYTALLLGASPSRKHSAWTKKPAVDRDKLLKTLHGGDPFVELIRPGVTKTLVDFVQLNATCSAPTTYDEAESMAFDPELIGQIVAGTEATVVVEVGVFRGRSTFEFARRLRELHGGYVVAVDTFLGDAYMWASKKTKYMPRLARHAGFPLLYYCFALACLEANLTNLVVPLPLASSQAYRVLDMLEVEADVVYVDAGHDALDILEDITHYWLLLRCGGVMFGDDYHWASVRVAVDAFAARQALTVDVRGRHRSKWVLSRKPC